MKRKQIKIDRFEMFMIVGACFTLGLLVEKIAIYGLNALTVIYKV